MKNLLCSCGGDHLGPNHILGQKNCYRKEATGNLIPTNFRKEKLIDSWIEAYDCCDVKGVTITEHTLTQQRGYAKHPDGRWSLPKSEESIISIGENW